MADTWYVNGSSGADNTATTGKTTGDAFRSITYAISRAATGDTINVMAGSYNEFFTIGKGLTIQNYSSDVVYVDGEVDENGLNTGLPNTNIQWNDVGAFGRVSSWKGLVTITASNVTWDGIHVINSLGDGIVVGDGKTTLTGVTIQNCHIKNCRRKNMQVLGDGTSGVWITLIVDNVISSYSGMIKEYGLGSTNWPGNLSFKGTKNAEVRNTHALYSWGDCFICDGNGKYADNLLIEDCTFGDAWNYAINLHAVQDATVQRCVVYSTATGRKYINNGKAVPYGAQGILANGGENTNQLSAGPAKEIKITNNIIMGMASGGVVARQKNQVIDYMFANNVISNCRVGIKINCPLISGDSLIKNNIITNIGDDDVVGTAANLAQLDWDYNCWDSLAAVPANAKGGNEVEDNDAIKDRTWTAPDHVKEPSISALNTYFDTLANGGTLFTSAANAATLNPDGTSLADNAGVDLSAQYAAGDEPADATDFFGTAYGTWDIGCHETSGGVSHPTATATAGTSSGNEPLSVSFTGAAASGTAPYTYYWDFGDGSGTSTSQNPSYTYNDTGRFTATLTVTDANGLTDTDTDTVTVYPVQTGGEASVVVEAVQFAAGDATYSVSGSTAPKAIMIVSSNATSTGSTVADSTFIVGFWANGSQVASCITGEDAQGTSDVGEVTKDDYVWLLSTPGAPALDIGGGYITSVTASTVSLTWTGTTNSEPCTAYNFYGSGVTNAAVITQKVNGNTSVTGDYNFMIAAMSGRNIDEARDRVDFSMGFAERSGPTQMCLGIGNKYNLSTTEVASELRNNRIMARPIKGDDMQISSWSDSGFQLSPSLSGLDIYYVALAMNLHSDATVYIEQITLPTSTGNNDYTNANFQAQAGFGLMSRTETVNSNETGSNAGLLGFFSVDNATPDVDHSYVVSSKDDVTTSVEKSRANSKVEMLDEDGAVTLDADATLEATGLRLAATTALSSSKLGILCLIKELSAGAGGPTADFDYAPALPDTTDTVNFYDTSATDGTDAITGWAWDFDDGATSTSQNPTHSFDVPGSYQVELTVTDANSDTDNITRGLTVLEATNIDVIADISPQSGDIPLEVTLDATGSTAPTGQSFNEDATEWRIYEITDPDPDIGLFTYNSTPQYTAFGIDTTVEIDRIGTWLVSVTLVYATTGERNTVQLIDDFIYTHPASADLSLYAQDGKVNVEGAYTANFVLGYNREDTDESAITWDFGDGATSSSVGEVTSTHTYNQQYYVDFNATSTDIDCGSDAALDDLHDDAMTVEAWIKADGNGEGDAGRIVSKGNWELYIDATSGLVGEIACATTNGQVNSNDLTADGEWHHIAMTWDDAADNYPGLWIDGVAATEDGTQNRVGAIATDAANSVIIGNNAAGSGTWDGGIAWVRISDSVRYTGAFTPPGRGAPPQADANTVEQWNLNDGSGTTADALVDTPTNDGTITDGSWQYHETCFSYDVKATVSYSDGDQSVTETGYITICPPPTPPLNVAELVALGAEVRKHIGCLSDATWVQDGTSTNVYTATVSRKWAADYGYTVKEDGQDLTAQTSIANCQGSAGSAYVNYSDPNLEVSVHPTNSDDPGTNGSVYSLRFGPTPSYYVEFNGTSSYISFGSDASLDDLFSADCTIEFWSWRSGVTDTYPQFIGKGVWVTSGWNVYANTTTTTGYIDVNYDTTDLTEGNVDLFPFDSAWHHVAFVFDSTAKTVEVFLDGVSQGTSAAGVGTYDSDAASNLVVGARPDSVSTGNLQGRIAWIRLSDSKRYTAGFTPAAKDSPPAVDANTVEQWNLDEGSGTTAAAQVSTPTNDGTITSGTWGTL